MFHASNLEVRESGYTAFGLSDRWNEFSPNTEPPRGKWGNNTHNSHEVPYLNIDFGVGYPGVRTTFSHMATPLVLYPVFLDKTNFPRILTPRARYQQDPSTHGPVPEHCLALPGCTAAGGTRHRSPVPIYPLGLDKANLPRIPENIFILSSGRNEVCVARYASHYFSKEAICVPLDDQEKT